MINKTIGNYKITKLIGEGGMASVYEAEHEMLGTKVAIKVLNPILSANSQIKERFRNEAKLMASLDHPNITRVIDFDDQPNQLSIVMEFLKGEDLNQKIKREGALKEPEILKVFTQILLAFQYAHEHGIVHRDIKPSNIFILPDGTVKILDFGIAKLFGQGSEITQTGTQLGTPIYMSPEQVKADKTIDYRSDIYSLGVTMFFAVNGKPPYNSGTDSQFDIFNKIVYEPLPEIESNSVLAELVKKACNKDRNQRFQSCEEFLEKLKASTSTTSEKEKTIIDSTYQEQNQSETTDFDNKKTNENQNNKSNGEEVNLSSSRKKKKNIKIIFYIFLTIVVIFFFKFTMLSNSLLIVGGLFLFLLGIYEGTNKDKTT
jgi:serine/threonine protein kinase